MATILVTWPFEQTLIPYHTETSHENKTVFSEENYIPQPYFVVGLILEWRWGTPKHCNLLVFLNENLGQGH